MMRKLLLLLLLFGVLPGYGQEDSISEVEFWSRLQMTETLLGRTMRTSTPDGILESITLQWLEVKTIQLEGGETLTVDMSWLTNISRNQISERLAQVQALLAYKNAHGGLPPSSEMPSELDDIRERFRYEEEQRRQLNPSVPGLAILSQFFLLIVGILAIIGLVYYLFKDLQVQESEIKIAEDELPTTSEAADQLAERSFAATDYRSAIRYLYLASLLLLDERGIIHYDPAQTNREHLQQVKNQPRRFELLNWIVNIFDTVWYGFAPADEMLYQQFRQRVDQLKQIQ